MKFETFDEWKLRTKQEPKKLKIGESAGEISFAWVIKGEVKLKVTSKQKGRGS